MSGNGSGAAPAAQTWTLTVAVLGSSMIFIDGTAVNVALPAIGRDVGATAAELQWVVEAYALFLSALILIGGSLGDILGRRRVFGAGIAAFTAASIACAAAPSVHWLIPARCLQGVGGALATPGSLALISAAFSGAARGRAIGTWSGASVIVSAIGPVLGGWLAQAVSWRAIFLVNVPIGVVVLAIVTLRVGESRDAAGPRTIDVLGASFATAGLGALVYGLIGLENGRIEPGALVWAAAGAAGLAAFVIVESRVRAPMVRLDLFASRAFTVANAYTLLLYAALGGSLYFVPFDLINVQGYAPAAAGAALLPTTLLLFVLSRWAGGLAARIGARIPLVGGALLAAAAFATFAAVGVGRPYALSVLPASLLLGCGAAAFVAPLTTLVMGAVDASHAGTASGVNNAISRTAGLIAIAVLGIALAFVFRGAMDRALAHDPVLTPVRAIVTPQFARIVSGAPPRGIADPRRRAAVEAAVRAAYARGFSVVMLASAGLALGAALLALDPALAPP